MYKKLALDCEQSLIFLGQVTDAKPKHASNKAASHDKRERNRLL